MRVATTVPEPPADAELELVTAAAAALTPLLTGVNGWLTGHCVVDPRFLMTVPWREAIAAGCTLMYVRLSGGAAP